MMPATAAVRAALAIMAAVGMLLGMPAWWLPLAALALSLTSAAFSCPALTASGNRLGGLAFLIARITANAGTVGLLGSIAVLIWWAAIGLRT